MSFYEQFEQQQRLRLQKEHYQRLNRQQELQHVDNELEEDYQLELTIMERQSLDRKQLRYMKMLDKEYEALLEEILEVDPDLYNEVIASENRIKALGQKEFMKEYFRDDKRHKGLKIDF